jgi:hypothetical protein
MGLLGQIVEEGRRFAATADMKVSDMSAQAPVGTTLALLERQLKVMSAVQARLHYTFKQELRLLAAIIRDYTDPDYDYDPIDAPRKAKKEDYDHVDIIPVSDPNAATMSQRVVQYQAVIQMAQMAPDIYDLPQLHRQMLGVLGIKDADKLVPLPDDMKPKDPVSENMSIIKGEPAKAFMFQDHQAHIQVHMAMTQDPSIAQLLGQNPKAPQMQAALMAHIAEHIGFEYRRKVEEQLGAPLPKYDENLPPEAEHALAGLLAQASQQVVQQSQTQAAQQQAKQQAQDPIIQMQQAELQLKQQELQLKQQELQNKAQESQARLAMDQKRLEFEAMAKNVDQKLAKEKADAQIELEGFKASSNLAKDKEQFSGKMELEGFKAGQSVAQNKSQNAMNALNILKQQKEKPTK